MKFQSITPRACAALFVILFAAFASAPAFAQATTTTTNEDIPFTSSVFNQCNGDNVTFSGTMHVVNTLTTDADGGTHLKTHTNYQDVTGTGTPSGITYRVKSVSNEVVNDNDGPQYNATVISTLRLNAQGPALNYFLRIVMHVTINANGETTTQTQEVSVECRGNQN